jgi:thiol-disulfide isomerase/thioredoxin
MKLFPYLFFLLAGLTARSQQSFTIKAFLPEWNGATVVVSKNDLKAGSGRITGDIFSFTSQVKEAGFGTLHISKNGKKLVFPFFLESGTISIRAGSEFKLFAYGTPLNNAYKEFQDETDSLAVISGFTKYKEIKRQHAATFIADQPGSLLSLRLLKELFYLDPSANDSIYYSLYQLLSDSLQQTVIGKRIGEEASVRFFTSPGSNVPVISLQNENDQPAFIFSPGRITIIHFWASWCVPCKRELADLKSMLAKYGERNVKVVTVSLDKDPAAWKRSIEPPTMNWQQLLDRKAFEGKAAKLFGVKNIPANFLVDSDGKIIARHINVREIENIISEFHD